MTPKTTLYQFIIDRSGSMASLREQIVEGFNAQLKGLNEVAEKHPDQHYLIGLTTFSTTVHPMKPAAEHTTVAPLSYADYIPEGLTALYDAIGGSISNIQHTYKEELASKSMNVILFVFTDGEENNSQDYNGRAIQKLFRSLRKSEQWSVNLIGAEVETDYLADYLGLQAHEHISISRSDTGDAFEVMAKSILSIAEDMEENDSVQRFSLKERMERLKKEKGNG